MNTSIMNYAIRYRCDREKETDRQRDKIFSNVTVQIIIYIHGNAVHIIIIDKGLLLIMNIMTV